jgi:hypothetical protein
MGAIALPQSSEKIEAVGQKARRREKERGERRRSKEKKREGARKGEEKRDAKLLFILPNCLYGWIH